jgi:sigma-E factor negative regulatory protein RseB
VSAEQSAPPPPGSPHDSLVIRAGRAAAATLLALLLVVLVLVALGGPGATASAPVGERPESPGDGRGPATDPRAAALLQRADVAMRDSRWKGTQFVAAWSRFGEHSALLEVEHLPGRGSLVRAFPGREAVSGLALVPDPPLDASVPTGWDRLVETEPTSTPLATLEKHFALVLGGPDTCAGRDAQIVEVKRRDAEATLAARFWLDEQTGLLLRREVLDRRGRIVRASAYLDLDVLPSGRGRAGVRADPPDESSGLRSVSAAPLRAEGWPVHDELGGLELTSVQAGGHGEERIVHLGYTDGLSHISVFAQSGRLDRSALADWERHPVGGTPAWVRDGVPQRVAWATGGTVYTVLADAPSDTLDAAVAALPGSATGGPGSLTRGLRERMARGLDRVRSWVDPGS